MKPQRNITNNDDDDDSKGISNWKKLKLLFWKNWILQWNNKMQFLMVLLLPVFFLMLIVLLRTLVEPASKPETRYPPMDIDSLSLLQSSVMQGNRILHENGTLNLPKPVLCYTPTNPVNTAIMAMTTMQLQLLGWRGYDTPSHMEYDLITHNYLVGVQFKKPDNKSMADEVPLVLNYSLRFPSELRTQQGPIIDTWRTNSLYPGYDGTGPRNFNASDGGLPVGYLMEGFLPLQHAVTMSWLRLATGASSPAPELPTILLQRFPYNPYIYDPLLGGLQQMLPFVLLLSFIYPCSYVAKYVTSEKELQLKEIMKLMGLHNWLHWTAWFVKSYLLLMLIVMLLMILLLNKFYTSVAILTYCHWSLLLFFLHTYVVASICFCFMMAVFFSKASTAAAVTGIMWFLTYIPYSFAYYYYERLSLVHKLILCLLLSNTALGFGIHVIMAWEGTGEGVQWSNIFEPVSADDSLSLFYVILMLSMTGFIYMLICLYVEQIHPGDYGVPKRWNYPFKRQFWHALCVVTTSSSSSEDNIDNASTREDRVLRETIFDDSHLRVGIQLRNLHKTYGQREAVKGLSLNMYRDEITVLLGHNGAGKTTTIMMLTGIIPPTTGTALINGCDIRTQLDCARRSLGICPQHNVLFDGMSVRNHIIFFSSVKGVQGSKALEREVDKYVRIMELEDKANVIAARLSGGMKRKLSLCCALCGNTKTVLCDEPSSGVDAAARRRLWNLLQTEKVGRTVLLTTHHMDEADVLGDRIAIMSEGLLQCYGTPFYLKKRYGDGYRLICVKRPDCQVDQVTKLLSGYMPGIKLERELGTELTYRLPAENTPQYADILSDLEAQSEQLGLDGFGVSVASLEEVFMHAGAEHSRQAGGKTDSKHKLADENKSGDFMLDTGLRESRACRRCLMRWQGLLSKKMLTTRRHIWLLILQFALPVVFMSLTVFNSRGSRVYYSLPAMQVSLSQYPNGYLVLESENSSLSQAYAAHVKQHGGNFHLLNTNGKSFEEFILAAARKERVHVDYGYLAGATLAEDKCTVWLNNKPLHTAPLTLNLLHNALARDLLGAEAGVGVTNAPLPYSEDTLTLRLNKGQRLGAEIAGNLCVCMCFVTAFYVLPVIRERQTRAKLLQYLSGVGVFAYWATHLMWDFATFALTALLGMLTIGAFHELGYSSVTELGRYLAVLLVFGLAALPLSYALACCFTDAATGFTRTAIICTLTGTGFFTLVVALSFEAFQLRHVANKLVWYFRVFPHFSLASGMHHIHIGFNIRRGCSMPMIQRLNITQICASVPICCEIPDYFGWSDPGVLPEVVYLLATGACLFILLLLLDARKCAGVRETLSRCCNRLRCCQPQREPGGEDQSDNDDDISQERLAIERLTEEQRAELPLVVDRICKRYGSHEAVKDLSFRVARAECFGLLGVNGAGKTSTFKMLTGDERISGGVAYVEGINLRTQLRRAYARIGYCPQFDALFEDLTGRETMRIYCLLRGVQRRHIYVMCRRLAEAFGFQQHLDKPTKHYSGGNKRKLSAALALVGNPAVMYLDEPTSGMDPGARRQLWDMLAKIRQSGRAIVLTSHSMEECEALCTRLAIMVRGEFKCMGSTQHLKNKYSKGFILKIKVMPGTQPMERRSAESSNYSFTSESTLQSAENEARLMEDKQLVREFRNEDEQRQLEELNRMSELRKEGRTEEIQTNKSFLATAADRRSKLEQDKQREQGDVDSIAERQSTSQPSEHDSVEEEGEEEQDDTISQNTLNDNDNNMLVWKSNVNLFRSYIEPNNAEIVENRTQDIREFIELNIPGATLQEEYQGQLTYYIPIESIKWSEIFRLMESNREDLLIEDYIITQTTLEEIFLEFAREPKSSTDKRNRGCSCC